ncbi:AAA domain-containing protein [Psidium guajava]|nr:AAA domain-containing protein [Psidium guajava]
MCNGWIKLYTGASWGPSRIGCPQFDPPYYDWIGLAACQQLQTGHVSFHFFTARLLRSRRNSLLICGIFTGEEKSG